jgi:hypothetical protein
MLAAIFLASEWHFLSNKHAVLAGCSAFWPVNCIFLHKKPRTRCTAEWPFCYWSLFCGRGFCWLWLRLVLRYISLHFTWRILERKRSRWAKPLRRRVHGNVVEPESGVTVLFNIVDSYEQCAMRAAKHCSILFSSVLHQPERFYACIPRQLSRPSKFK